jgi:beta-keto acid cleavage enzyme
MAEPVPAVLIVYAPAVMAPATLAVLCVEVARVGASAVRLPSADPSWLASARSAIEAATDLIVLAPDVAPRELLLGEEPIAQLHAADSTDLVVGGPAVSALLAGLAAGTHLRAGSADTPGDASVRHEVQLVARAAALSRLAGRVPMTTAEARVHLA